MTDYLEDQDRRDKVFKRHALGTAESRVYYVREWIQQELNALQPRIEMLADADGLPAALKGERRQALDAVVHINRNELDDSIRRFESLCDEIEAIDDVNPYAHYQELQDSIWRFEQITRRLMDIREMVNRWWQDGPSTEDEPTTVS